MKFFNLDRINQYRKELMGISAIGILAVHAIRKEVVMPAILQHILSLGGYGVDIFILLSGIGMAFSTDKISGGGYWKWYKHRFFTHCSTKSDSDYSIPKRVSGTTACFWQMLMFHGLSHGLAHMSIGRLPVYGYTQNTKMRNLKLSKRRNS